MAQHKIVLAAGVGLLGLCGIALGMTLVDSVTHPAVADVHVPPYVAPSPVTAGAADATPPLPTVQEAPPTPASATPAPGSQSQQLQNLFQSLTPRHRHPHG